MSLYARDPPHELALRRRGSKAVITPVSIVWPCSLSVDEYVAAGRDVEVPRPTCPVCCETTTFWSGYRRNIREGGRYSRLWVPRVRCDVCSVTHALLPAFVVTNRLDVVESIGSVLDDMDKTSVGVRPVAERLDIPHTTARGWVRRFAERSVDLAVSLAALAIDLGGEVVTPPYPDVSRALLDRCCMGGGVWTARVARVRPLAVHLVGHRRELHRHQHELALPLCRQKAFHASCPVNGTTTKETT